MDIVLLGPPGSGKGTQADMLAAKHGIAHLSTGEMIREEVRRGTKRGRGMKSAMEKGELVPDNVVIEILGERISGADCNKGFVLDGFPRTIVQAETLGRMMSGMGKKLDMVINIAVGDESVIKRISGRRVCSGCGANYHVIFNPPKNDNMCNTCGSVLQQRPDDTEQSARNRLRVYNKQTEPLIAYYRSRKLLADVDGERSIPDVSAEIEERIKEALHGV